MKAILINAATQQPVQPWQLTPGVSWTPLEVRVVVFPGEQGVEPALQLTVDMAQAEPQRVWAAPMDYR